MRVQSLLCDFSSSADRFQNLLLQALTAALPCLLHSPSLARPRRGPPRQRAAVPPVSGPSAVAASRLLTLVTSAGDFKPSTASATGASARVVGVGSSVGRWSVVSPLKKIHQV